MDPIRQLYRLCRDGTGADQSRHVDCALDPETIPPESHMGMLFILHTINCFGLFVGMNESEGIKVHIQTHISSICNISASI